MPSERQSGHDTTDYDSQAERVMAEWSDKAILRLYPTGEALAREYLGKANEYDRGEEVKRHLAERVAEQSG